MSSTAQKTSLFDKISLENFGLGETTVTEDSSFSLEAATAEFDRLASGLATSFVVLGHSQLMAAALESSGVEVSAQTTEVMEVNEMSMSAILDTLEVSMEAEEEAKDDAKDDAKSDDKEPGMVGKAWEKIKSFFKMIGAWFKKQWKKLTGALSSLAARFRKKGEAGDEVPAKATKTVDDRISALEASIAVSKSFITGEGITLHTQQLEALKALKAAKVAVEKTQAAYDKENSKDAWDSLSAAMNALENDGMEKYVAGLAEDIAESDATDQDAEALRESMKIIEVSKNNATENSKLSGLAK